MRELIGRITSFIRRLYRLSLTISNQEVVVWEDMKKLHAECEWRSGVFEADRCIETVFPIAENTSGLYMYWVTENELHCVVKVLDGYSPELATEIFVLASHFNNHLKHGTVEVNVSSSTVSYRLKQNVLIPCLYAEESYHQLMMHYNTSKDVYWAFQRLVRDSEDPALIFADLLNMRDERQEKSENN